MFLKNSPGDKIKEDEIAGKCGTLGEEQKC
jgi:hypothetical protein